jgi:hypothetical protein
MMKTTLTKPMHVGACVALLMSLAVSTSWAQNPAPPQVWVNQTYASGQGNDGHVWNTDAFATIQDGINAVALGGTVNVAAGTYTEQLNISQDISVIGQGAATVIQSPAALAVNYNYNTTDNRAIVFIHDTGNAVLQNLTVDGNTQGDANYRFLGVSFYHSGGKALNLTVQNVRGSDALFGMQSGIGLYAENRGQTTQRNVEVGGCQFLDCQKGGMTFNGSNLVANVHGNTVVGAGPTGQIAQNGIQIGYGATGTVVNNEVTGFAYTGNDEACGVLVYQAGATVSGNVLANNQDAINVDSPTAAMGPITLNDFAGSTSGVSYYNVNAVLQAPSNWWGNASGPSNNGSNPGGTGVAVSDNVSFSPWLTAPTQVWVNSVYGPTNQNDGHFWGTDAFSSIQAAVNAVGANGIVNVASGTYGERVVVQTAGITVRGAGISSIVTGTAAAPGAGITPAVFKIAANGVTISNFMIQVDFAHNHSGVHSSGLCSGLTIASNTIVASVTGTPAFSYGLRNAIAVNPSLSTAGYTSLNGGFAGVSVTGNTIQGTGTTLFRAGIQMDYCGGTISGNTSTSINHDFISRFASQGDLTVNNNTFLGGGAQFGSFNPGAGTVIISGNVFDNSTMQPATGSIGTGASLRLSYYAEVSSVNNNVIVSGNTFRNHRWGVSVEDFMNVTFDHNTFTPKANATDYIHMTFNTKVIASTSADAALNMFAVGATLTGNTFNGSGSAGGTALAFYNHRSSDAVFGTYTLGTPGNENSFNAGIANFIALDASSGASSSWTGFGEYAGIPATTMAPWSANLDVQNNQFDVGNGLTLPAAMTVADLFGVENRIQHKVDNSALGLVRVKATNLFVTQNSGSIQRGIAAATAGDTVNVAAGTFVEQLNIGQDLMVTGQGATTIIQSPAVLALTYTDTAPIKPVVYVHDTANAVVQNFSVDGGGQGNANVRFAGVGYYQAGGVVSNLLIQGIRNTPLDGLQAGYGIRAYADATPRTLTVAGCTISDFQKNGIDMRGAALSAVISGNTVTGAGSTDVIAQNGIVFVGATGTIANNDLSGFSYEPMDVDACGVLIYGGGATITGNNIANSQVAVELEDPLTAMGNIADNNFASDMVGVANYASATVNASSNWWGSASGPGNVSGSVGADVSYNVIFSPWLADGTDTSGAVGFQPNAALVNESAPTQVWVNQAYGMSAGNDGHLWGYNAFNTIQAGINGVATNGTVNVAAGTYSENVVLAKTLELAGAGQAATVIVPAVSSPIGTGGDYDVFGGGTASIVLLVQASDVKIHDLTVDGNNPAITSGVVSGGVDVDARAGILTDNRNGTFDRLDVHNVTVRNIYLRGIENLNGHDIHIVGNTVQNVWGSTDASIGIFNRVGSGLIANNTVSGTPDAISANFSQGTRFLTNTITLSASGIHSDNNGDVGGPADVIQGNTVLDGMPDSSGNSYGIWVFGPYAAVVVEGNTVSNVLYGLSVMGQFKSVAPIFSGNTVLGTQAPGSIGISVDTSMIGWGSANVEAVLSGNFVSNCVTGVLLDQETGYTASLVASNNFITANGVGMDLNGGQALLQNNNLTDNQSAVLVEGATDSVIANLNNFAGCENGVINTAVATVNALSNWWGSASGPSNASNPGGTGAIVSGRVDFSPWLGDGTDTSSAVGFQPNSTLVYETTAPYFTQIPAGITATNDPGQCGAVVNYTTAAMTLAFFQGFENPGWVSGSSSNTPSTDWNDYNSHITRVASGTDGIASKSGSSHAVIDSTIALVGDSSGAFSRLGGYDHNFGNGYVVKQDVYIDLNDSRVTSATATSGYAWDLSAGASGQDGNYLRDFIFHVAAYDATGVVIAADNGSADSALAHSDYRGYNNTAKITSSGWYTFQWNFRAANNVLAADLSVKDASGAVVFSQTLSNAGDLISTVVGGHRYLWFTFINADKLAIDNTSLERNATVVNSIASGAQFPVGTTTVTSTATDALGNSTNATFAVTVLDRTAPVWTELASDVTVTTLQDKDPYATGIPTASDTCSSATVAYDDNRAGLNGSNSTGHIVRTWTATDASGNTTNYVQTITVIDTNAPCFTQIPADITATNDPGQCGALVNYTTAAMDLGYFQGFENPNWVSGSSSNTPSTDWNDYNSHITRVASGTDGIASKSGSSHAVIDSTAALADDSSGAFSRLGGYDHNFGNGYVVKQDVFINLNDSRVTSATATSGYAWDLSAGATGQDGNYLRDFIFHVAAYDATGVVIAADNSSADSALAHADYRGYNNTAKITSSGWYTFQWNFRAAGNVLAADLSVKDASGTVVFSQTLSNASDLISTVVGGHRYLWFTFINADKLAIDNTTLERNATVVNSIASGAQFPVGTTTVTSTATDALGNSTNATFAVTVVDTTVTTLVTCPTSSVYGDPVTFTATVHACPLPPITGTVTFFEGTVALGTGTLGSTDTNGTAQATLVVSNLVAGSHTITANYAGDVLHLASTSAGATLDVYPTAVPVLTFDYDAQQTAHVHVEGVSGFKYEIQASTNLVDWVSLQTNLPPIDLMETNNGQFTSRFFRVRYIGH